MATAPTGRASREKRKSTTSLLASANSTRWPRVSTRSFILSVMGTLAIAAVAIADGA
jgi:heme/copper-type cytochrome/quinol oxidase subunit 1